MGQSKRTLLLSLGSVFLMGAFLGYRQIGSPDLGFHLSSARWIIENGAIPIKDIFTYTVTGNTYIDLQWSFQLIVYGIERLFGSAGITILTMVLTLFFGGTLLFRVCRRDGRLPFPGLVMLGIFFLGNYWEIRPHLFSWIYGSLILLVLEEHSLSKHIGSWGGLNSRSLDRGRGRSLLWLLPVLMLLWVNGHSLYVLGVIIIGSYVFSDVVIGFWKRGHYGRFDIDKGLIIWGLAAVGVCVINPYHIKGLWFPVSQFFLIQGDAGYKSVLTGTAEFVSPFRFQEYFIDGRFVLLQPRFWWQVFTVLAVAGMIGASIGNKGGTGRNGTGSGPKARLAEWVLFVGFLYIFHQANKNFGYFVMVCFPVVVSGLSRVSGWLENKILDVGAGGAVRTIGEVKGRQGRLLTHKGIFFATRSGFIFICILVCIGAASNWLYEVGWQGNDFGAGYSESRLPVGACEFINGKGIKGRLINSWDDGGYIGWATGQKVFINSEGNTIGLDFYDEYIRAREPGGFEAALAKWEPGVAVVRYDITPYWLYYFDNVAGDWRQVYDDGYYGVFLRETFFPGVGALPGPQAGRDYEYYDTVEVERATVRAVEAGGAGWRQWLRGSAAYPLEQMRRSAYYLHTGEIDACTGTCVEGLNKAGFAVPELMLNLGHSLNAKKEYRLADLCYNYFLSIDDDPVIAEEILMQRRRRR